MILCKNCPYRTETCHTYCLPYLESRKKQDKMLAERHKQISLVTDINEEHVKRTVSFYKKQHRCAFGW